MVQDLGNWQLQMLPDLVEMASGDSRIRDLGTHGSASGDLPRIDRWSDLDLVITAREPVTVAEDFAHRIGARFSPVFAASRSGSSVRYTLRLVLSDLRRLDITAVDPADREIPPGPIHAVGDDPPCAMAELVNDFRFDAVLAAVKAAREDVLIGAHLTLQLARYVLVAAMLLRDRDTGTSYHRFGGSRWDAWAARLASAPVPYDRTGITAAIRYYTNALDTLLSEWEPEPGHDHRPLFTLLDAVDTSPGNHQMR
ncbi:hypothetical protein [Streptomyces sp. NPDC047042]|uniref:hypothetical protein n=1 Tax=Streptomyces sp. NPDC047042 TaxID=3154807 RepID=UPI0033EBA7ED